MQMLQNGDIVEAMVPVTTKWSPASIHAIAKNGLVEVRWDDPGVDDKGKPFHPIGEVRVGGSFHVSARVPGRVFTKTRTCTLHSSFIQCQCQCQCAMCSCPDHTGRVISNRPLWEVMVKSTQEPTK